MRKKKKSEGFSLIEIALVLAIIGILAAGVFALRYQRVRMAQAQRTIDELKSVARAGVTYYLNYQAIPTLSNLISTSYISIDTNPYGNSYSVSGTIGKTIVASTTAPAGKIPYTIDSAVTFSTSGSIDTLTFTEAIGYELDTGVDTLRRRKKWFYGE